MRRLLVIYVITPMIIYAFAKIETANAYNEYAYYIKDAIKPGPNYIIPAGTVVPVCLYSPTDPQGGTTYVHSYQFDAHFGDWMGTGAFVHRLESDTSVPALPASAIDPMFVTVNEPVCPAGNSQQIYGMSLTSNVTINTDFGGNYQLGNICVLFGSDGGGDSSGCSTVLGVPEYECHVTPERTQWDVGNIILGQPVNIELPVNIRLECGKDANPDTDYFFNVEVITNTVNGVTMTIFDGWSNEEVSTYLQTFKPNESDTWTIKLGGAPTETGPVQYTAVITINYM